MFGVREKRFLTRLKYLRYVGCFAKVPKTRVCALNVKFRLLTPKTRVALSNIGFRLLTLVKQRHAGGARVGKICKLRLPGAGLFKPVLPLPRGFGPLVGGPPRLGSW